MDSDTPPFKRIIQDFAFDVRVEFIDDCVYTPWGFAAYVQISACNDQALPWPTIQEAFNRAYPGHWAMQMHPPADRLVDELNCYHLFVLPKTADMSAFDICKNPVTP